MTECRWRGAAAMQCNRDGIVSDGNPVLEREEFLEMNFFDPPIRAGSRVMNRKPEVTDRS